MENQVVLNVNSLKKNYGRIQALKGVSFAVPKGSVYGILGPNGSGKTTLLGILLGVLNSKGGSYEWSGYKKVQDARKNIGSLLETPNFYHYLSAVDNLKIVAQIKRIKNPPIEEVLQRVSLYERKDSKFQTYSLGMKQRLAIASALLSNPDVIVFDEPTNGLDPEGIAEIRRLITELSQEGRTIIMASHLLDEVEKVCTHMAIMKKGDLLKEGTVEDILGHEKIVELKTDDLSTLQNKLQAFAGIKETLIEKETLVATLQDGYGAKDVNQYCFEQNITLSYLVEGTQRLEKTFLELIK